MFTASTYQAHEIASEVSIVEGKGGFPYINIDNEFASASICIYGAQVLSFKSKEENQKNADSDVEGNAENKEVFFVSELATFEEGVAIRGGVPICWPWFGRHTDHPKVQMHGFVRNMLWTVEEIVSLDSGEIKVVLSITQSEDSYKLWPHDFQLKLTIKVGKTLSVSLQSTNTGKKSFSFTQAMHPYFSISDISNVKVSGLDKVTYLDKVAGQESTKVQEGDISVDREVDRIYTDAPSEVQILDSVSERKISIKSNGSATTVVWNPWIDISKRNTELTDDAYLGFICVETANAAEDIITLAPNESHTIEAEYSVS